MVHLTTANQSKMRRAHLVSVDIGADWVESGRAGENPQPEGKEKQAGWVESGGTGESPQPEVAEKQVGCTCQQILDTKYKKIVSYIVRLYTPYATLDIAPRNAGQIIPTV